MTEFQKRKIAYLFFGTPFFLICVICLTFKVPLFSSLYLLAGFFLPVVYITPGMREKISQKKHALSFIKILYIIKDSSEKLLPLKGEAREIIARHIPSLLMINVIYTLTSKGLLPLWFIGVLLFEAVFKLYSFKVAQRDGLETREENSL